MGPLFSVAKGINEPGRVAGITYSAGSDTRAFLSTNGRVVQLGTLGGTTSDISDAGQIAGSVSEPASITRAVRWTVTAP